MTTYFNIASELNEFVLDIEHGNVLEGTPVVMHPFTGGTHQLWYHDINTGAVHSKKDNGFVLDIENDKLVVKSYVQGRHTQRFGLGPKYIYRLTSRCEVLDVEGNNPNPLAPVILFTFTGAKNQSWKYNNVLAEN